MNEQKLYKDMTPEEQNAALDEYVAGLNVELRSSTSTAVALLIIFGMIFLIVRLFQWLT